jgi:hypothetical protein
VDEQRTKGWRVPRAHPASGRHPPRQLRLPGSVPGAGDVAAASTLEVSTSAELSTLRASPASGVLHVCSCMHADCPSHGSDRYRWLAGYSRGLQGARVHCGQTSTFLSTHGSCPIEAFSNIVTEACLRILLKFASQHFQSVMGVEMMHPSGWDGGSLP